MGVHGGGDFWTFLASMSPFESWRKYLMFCHKRDQDRRFREAAESRRLDLENDARELALLEKRVRIGRQLGATKEQLKPLCNRILGCGPGISADLQPTAQSTRETLLLIDGYADRSSAMPNSNGHNSSDDTPACPTPAE
jgi:hypothetical protein